MSELCFEVAGRYDALCDKNHWKLDLQADDACPVSADPAMMERVLHNLLGNAFHHIGADGVVVLRAVPQEKGCRIEIEDHGPGIPPEDLPYIFDRYYRARQDSGRTGTGLGLPIVKSLVQLMGGTIDVESTVGKGSTFTVVIPFPVISKEELIQQREQPADPAAGLAGKHLLLAEDNDLNAEIALTILQENGMIVNRAEDGIRCLELLGAKPAGYYDAVLLSLIHI